MAVTGRITMTNEYRVRYRRMMSSHVQQRVFQRRYYAERFVHRLLDAGPEYDFAFVVIESREVGPWMLDQDVTPW